MNGFPARNIFDALAPFYEWHGGRTFLDNSILLFRRTLAPRLKPGDLVIELCCGTGHFAQSLAGQGYAELEAYALSRDIPVALRLFVSPIVRRASRSSLDVSLHQTKVAIDAHKP